MALLDTTPKLGDTDNNLLHKIAANTAALVGSGGVADNVNVLTLPPTPAGTNNIGDVDVLTLPSIPAGANNIGSVNVAGGGTMQYAEDTAGAAGDLVTLAGASRKDVPGTLVDTDGDRAELQVDANGRLRVTSADARVNLTASAPTLVVVGVATTVVTVATPTRKGLVLTNTSVNVISLAFGVAATLNNGITMVPGDSFIMDDYCFTTAAVNAIAAAAASILTIQEYTGVA